jgi:hypothetical protein
MYELLYNKIVKKYKDFYRKDEDGDLEANNGEHWSSDEDDDDDEVTVKNGSKKEIAVLTPKTSAKANRKRTLESSSSSLAATVPVNKKGKHASTSKANDESDTKNGEITDKDLLVKIREFTKRQSTSNDRRSQIKLLTSAIRSALDSVDGECDSLQDLTGGAVSTTANLRDHRIKAENGKRKFQEDYRQAYRALHREYLRMRRLLYSNGWWYNGFDHKEESMQREALEFYYDQTHPFCSLEMRENLPSIITSVHPSTTIADIALLGEEDMHREMDALYELPDGDDIAGLSLLQLAPDVQSHISETGQWPEDGVGTPGLLSEKMVDDVLSYRADFYRMNKISDKLQETNAHVMIARPPSHPRSPTCSTETQASVPSNPGGADNASSGAGGRYR